MAPMTAKVMAIFRPAKSCGSAPGSLMRSSVRVGEAPTVRISSARLGSLARNPASRLSVTGKKAMTAISRILGVRPKPNHRMKIGASATFGTVWNSTTSG